MAAVAGAGEYARVLHARNRQCGRGAQWYREIDVIARFGFLLTSSLSQSGRVEDRTIELYVLPHKSSDRSFTVRAHRQWHLESSLPVDTHSETLRSPSNDRSGEKGVRTRGCKALTARRALVHRVEHTLHLTRSQDGNRARGCVDRDLATCAALKSPFGHGEY